MFNLDTRSVHSETSSIATSTHSTTTGTSHAYYHRPICYGINTRTILGDQFDVITNRYLATSDYMKVPVASNLVTSALDDLKKRNPTDEELRDEFVERIELSLADLELRPKDSDDSLDDEGHDDTFGVASEFERYYGTSIRASIPSFATPYINFEAPTSETQAKLDELLASNQKKSLASKTTLTEDIEQQFVLRPLRLSKRQRKKANAEERSKTLGPKWFNMPRVAELTKEQEKDLAALKMRRVWNAKNFYKKNSTMLEGHENSGGAPSDGTKFFQIGTVVESKSDFYSDRVVKKQRKQTIIDELMHDQELRTYNKRKLKYAMSKNSRLRTVMMRAKQKRQKMKIKGKRAAKMNKAFDHKPMINSFKTYDL